MKKFIFSLLVLLLCFGCLDKNNNTYKFSGTLEMTEYSVGPAVAGKIEKVYFDEEQQVKKGDVIAVMSHYEVAKADYDRSLALIKSGNVSEQKFEHDRQDMEDQQVLSPVDGVVLVKVRESGEIVPAGSPVAVIGEKGNIWVKVYVPEGVINRVTTEQKAVIKLDGLKKEFKGHVIFVATMAEYTPRNVQTEEERISQTFAVKVQVDDHDNVLRPGVAADVYFDLGSN